MNVLRANKIYTFKEIPQQTASELITFWNCGRKSVEEIQSLLRSFNLELGMEYKQILTILSEFEDEDIDLDNFKLRKKNRKRHSCRRPLSRYAG